MIYQNHSRSMNFLPEARLGPDLTSSRFIAYNRCGPIYELLTKHRSRWRTVVTLHQLAQKRKTFLTVWQYERGYYYPITYGAILIRLQQCTYFTAKDLPLTAVQVETCVPFLLKTS